MTSQIATAMARYFDSAEDLEISFLLFRLLGD